MDDIAAENVIFGGSPTASAGEINHEFAKCGRFETIVFIAALQAVREGLRDFLLSFLASKALGFEYFGGFAAKR